MKLGFAIPIVGSAVSSAAGLSAFCRGLEDLGYDTLWVGDRLVTPVDMHSTYPGKEQPYPPQMTRYLDPVLLWTVAATATSRVRLNASTLSTFYYEPPHLARLLTTLDVLSDGRGRRPLVVDRAPCGAGRRPRSRRAEDGHADQPRTGHVR
jgi:alkanesulfonate monooxygenase SsuD/methylene tetrahydromethanopterin reductase-like flavin-dependent oxidoreductase (luciferase family)